VSGNESGSGSGSGSESESGSGSGSESESERVVEVPSMNELFLCLFLSLGAAAGRHGVFARPSRDALHLHRHVLGFELRS
jgi:hypothetical protein